jgi:hypothetical protein
MTPTVLAVRSNDASGTGSCSASPSRKVTSRCSDAAR